MPALFAYLIAVTLLLGGGYGALSWLTTPEPVKAVAKTTPKPPSSHYPDNPSSVSTQANAPQASQPEPAKPEAPSTPEISGKDPVKAAASDKAPASEQPRSQPAGAPSQQEAKAEISDPPRDHRDAPPQVEQPQAATDQAAKQHAEAPPAEARHDDPAAVSHEEEKQSTKAASPGGAQTAASIAPAAKMAKRPRGRQASRGHEKRSLEVMTLRTIELPDGRRMTQLIPYRGRDLIPYRYRDDSPPMNFPMAFGSDE